MIAVPKITLENTIIARNCCKRMSCSACPYKGWNDAHDILNGDTTCIKDLENAIDYYLREYQMTLKLFEEQRRKND